MVGLNRQHTAGDTVFDLKSTSVREVNQYLHQPLDKSARIMIQNPAGAHNLAVGVDQPAQIEIHGHAGYYAAGMNEGANIRIRGNAGPGVAENMMSGRVEVQGFASASAGASAHGGLLVIRRDGGLRCGISLKGADIVVGGDVGSFSAFMAQAGRLIVCGDAGEGLGDSLYEAVVYVRGKIKSLGMDARIEPMTDIDCSAVALLLDRAEVDASPQDFKRVASARTLYHWNVNEHQEY